jgi:hypothetical protein
MAALARNSVTVGIGNPPKILQTVTVKKHTEAIDWWMLGVECDRFCALSHIENT